MNKSRNKIKILYCEDENITRKLVMRYINIENYDYYIAMNGAEGLELYKKYKPDIVITDISMPVMNGIELIEEINKLNYSKKPKTIITTSHKEAGFLLNAIKFGVNNFIVKPLDKKQIDLVFEKILSDVMMEKNLEYQTNLNKAILDFQDNLIITFNENKIINANKSFLDFFNTKDIHEFRLKYHSIIRTFEYTNIEYNTDEEWFNAVNLETSNKIVVKIKCSKTGIIKTFLVKYKDLNIIEKEFILSLTDITEIEEESKKFELQATTDILTKVYNRLKFNEIIETNILKSKNENIPFSLLMLDIDKFKNINDNYGHQVGDTVLIEISKLIKQHIRGNDIIARWGGEEFMVLLPNTELKNAISVAENLRLYIEKNNFSDVKKVTSSFGVGEFNLNETEEDLIKRIDNALYNSKSSGRNKVTISYYENI